MPGGGRLEIETSSTELARGRAESLDLEPGRHVVLAVTDTGTGIEPEQVRHVFEPFYTTKDMGKGTGLGLAMVYGFVKQSRGYIGVDSTPGRGTRFEILLPWGQGPLAEPEDNHNPVSDTIESGSETILLVEDDELVRAFAREQLSALGYRVLEADGGAAALLIFEREPDIDLLFTDVVMPGGMSGKQLAERANLLRPGLKVLYTSGYAEDAIVHGGRLDPDVELLGKPYRHSELARRVREVLSAPADAIDRGND